MIPGAAVDSLRCKYFGRPTLIANYAFRCTNALAEGASAELLPG